MSEVMQFFGEHYIVALISLSMVLHAPVVIINRILRHRNIRLLGYPPPHCDADGDFREDDRKRSGKGDPS